MTNSFDHKLKWHKVFEEGFRTRRRHEIEYSLHRNNYMSDDAVDFLRSMLNQKTCACFCPISSEPGMIDEMQFPFHENEVDEGAKRCDISLKH